jgi:hypothetical protein
VDGVSRENGAGIGACNRRRCCLWLLYRNAVDLESERARTGDGVAVGTQTVIGIVIVDLRLDGKLLADRA